MVKLYSKLGEQETVEATVENTTTKNTEVDADAEILEFSMKSDATFNKLEDNLNLRKRFTVKRVSKLRARLYLWKMDRLDTLHNLMKKHKVKKQEKTDKLPDTKVQTSVKQKQVKVTTQESKVVRDERKKLYSQFVNRLILLLINGIAVGGLLLASLDYVLNAQIPERSPILLGILLIIVFLSGVYWLVSYKRGKGIEGVRGVSLYALIICLCGLVVGSYDMAKNIQNLRTYFQGETIVIKDKQETAETIAGYINTWRHTPNYSKVYVSDTAYYATVYNSKGESITQLVYENTEETAEDTTEEHTHEEDDEVIKDLAICLKDGTAVIVTEDTIEHRKDVDNLRYVQLAYDWAAKGKARIERVSVATDTVPTSSVPEDALPGTEYVAIISGLEDIKKFYSTVLGDKATENMLQSLETVSGDISLSFHVSIAESYLGVAAVITAEGQDNLLWFIDNYIEVYDWSLGDYDWYTYDYKDAKQNELMIETAVFNSTDMLSQYGIDSGLSYEDSDTQDSE